MGSKEGGFVNVNPPYPTQLLCKNMSLILNHAEIALPGKFPRTFTFLKGVPIGVTYTKPESQAVRH
jgi:hypothetical protein